MHKLLYIDKYMNRSWTDLRLCCISTSGSRDANQSHRRVNGQHGINKLWERGRGLDTPFTTLYLYCQTHSWAPIFSCCTFTPHFSLQQQRAMEDNVKAFSVAYNPINGDNTFSAGDYISGNVTLELAKDCKITSLHVQLKGKARVQWTEHYGRTVVVYADKEKYFSLKQSLIQEFKGQGKCRSCLQLGISLYSLL